MKEVPLSVLKDDFSRFLHEAERQHIVITRYGKPAGVLIGFESEDDWFDHRPETDPRFPRPIEKARASLHAGRGVPLEDVFLSMEQIRSSSVCVRAARFSCGSCRLPLCVESRWARDRP
ncbi:MAG TPA: type II toxin-antitoxin system Phd/YefM family antitoxin [Geminicoccaceae bacterium]|nr:type II toxin-antitoxin system Phd/YefM family antitoxin [Geminicoccaceae bacterium]